MLKKYLSLGLALFCVFGLAACDEDEDCPQCPDTGTPAPTMANVWPHADGTAWTYDAVYREADGTVPVGKRDTNIPTMEDLHDALQDPLPGVILEEEGLYRLAFAGMDTTETGAVGQNLTSSFFIEPDQDQPTGIDPLIALVARARPDLRPAIAARYGVSEKSFDQVSSAPFFLGGGAYAYEDTGYYAYADVDLDHSWVYLAGDLSVGSEFSLQLVKGLADDIWLYGRIWGVSDRTVNGVAYENVLECMYVVDMGEQMVTNESGEVIGVFYPYMYGNSFFVPELGPVAGTERHVFMVDHLLEVGASTLIEYVLDLVGVTYGE